MGHFIKCAFKWQKRREEKQTAPFLSQKRKRLTQRKRKREKMKRVTSEVYEWKGHFCTFEITVSQSVIDWVNWRAQVMNYFTRQLTFFSSFFSHLRQVYRHNWFVINIQLPCQLMQVRWWRGRKVTHFIDASVMWIRKEMHFTLTLSVQVV